MAGLLSAQEAGRFREAFCYFDMDGDGVLAMKDVVVAMRSAGENIADDEITEMMNAHTDADAGIDIQRFMHMAEERRRNGEKRSDVREELAKAFKFFDRNQSGAIYMGELRHLLTSVGDKLSGHEFDSWLAQNDCDSNGRITFDALVSKLIPSSS